MAAAVHLNRCWWYESMKIRDQKFCMWTYVCTMTKNNGVRQNWVQKNAACGQALMVVHTNRYDTKQVGVELLEGILGKKTKT